MKYAYLFLASAFLFACGGPAEEGNTNETPADTTAAVQEEPAAPEMAYFGDEITPDGAIAPGEINAMLADGEPREDAPVRESELGGHLVLGHCRKAQ